ncbi:hypothetical protein [Arthrobacter bambusae]|uniref:hypothetical protein n=1 Tax=Arthrobacter bambusae TaxID=1338426 RepID=UPI002789C154|nr:hypothetical protein [Arthrobacter bambusae]MDQ0239184.1 hypothetical protein [Arthrobacter bambusae]
MTITSSTYDRIPGYAEHTEAEKRIRDEIASNQSIALEDQISSVDFADAALSGGAFPDEPHFENQRIIGERMNVAVRGDMLKDAAKEIQRRKQDLLREHADFGLKYLRNKLAALMEEVRETHATLGNIRTAERVLAANDPIVRDAWYSTNEIISRYVEIRSLQHALSAPGLGDGQGFKIFAVGHIRNSLEQSDYWLSKRDRSTSRSAANDSLEAVRNFDAWLGAESHSPFKHSTSAIPQTDRNGNTVNRWDYLVWLSTEAEPWVPTTAQLSAAYDAADLAVAQTDYKRLRAQEEGRDEYFEVIGKKPLVAYTNSPANQKPETRPVKRPSWGESSARALGM